MPNLALIGEEDGHRSPQNYKVDKNRGFLPRIGDSMPIKVKFGVVQYTTESLSLSLTQNVALIGEWLWRGYVQICPQTYENLVKIATTFGISITFRPAWATVYADLAQILHERVYYMGSLSHASDGVG